MAWLSKNMSKLVKSNDFFKAAALGECELTPESYHYKEFLTIPLWVFRKFTDYFKFLRDWDEYIKRWFFFQ